mgnify:CR=1 FL=1
MKKTPRQIVADSFGGRAQLVDAIVALTGEGVEAKSTLMGTTNKKLLRIHEAASQAQTRFGGKSGLIDALAGIQFAGGKPNAGWREKMEGHTVKRLLDHHRQLSSGA